MVSQENEQSRLPASPGRTTGEIRSLEERIRTVDVANLRRFFQDVIDRGEPRDLTWLKQAVSESASGGAEWENRSAVGSETPSGLVMWTFPN